MSIFVFDYLGSLAPVRTWLIQIYNATDRRIVYWINQLLKDEIIQFQKHQGHVLFYKDFSTLSSTSYSDIYLFIHFITYFIICLRVGVKQMFFRT